MYPRGWRADPVAETSPLTLSTYTQIRVTHATNGLDTAMLCFRDDQTVSLLEDGTCTPPHRAIKSSTSPADSSDQVLACSNAWHCLTFHQPTLIPPPLPPQRPPSITSNIIEVVYGDTSVVVIHSLVQRSFINF